MEALKRNFARPPEKVSQMAGLLVGLLVGLFAGMLAGLLVGLSVGGVRLIAGLAAWVLPGCGDSRARRYKAPRLR